MSDAKHQHGERQDATVRLTVPEMDCASCAEKVESAVTDVSGVAAAETRPTSGTVVLTTEGDDPTEQAVEAIEDTGYEVTDTGDDATGVAAAEESVWRSERGIKTGIGAVVTLLGLVVEFGFSIPSVAGVAPADALFVLAVVVSGTTILRSGYVSARERSLDMDLLMSIAVVGALAASVGFGAGLYMEAATLAVLFNVAELLERRAMDRARDSLRELLELAPETATVRRDGEEATVPVEEVAVGDTVLVRPGEKIPVDGAVTGGESAVNQAPITGESVPVDKTEGDEVYAGTINETGYLELRTTAASGADTLSRIISLVEDAQAERTEREQFVDRFAGYYTPLVVSLAALTAVVPPLALGGSPETWFLRGLTLIVLACPCAFVISTPVSVVSGVTSGAKNGVLVKGGRHLESMGELDAIALDKTGTLTTGELEVTDIVPVGADSEDEVLRVARGVEERSEHPIAAAIVDDAEARGVEGVPVDGFESHTGKGVSAESGAERRYAGKPGFFEELGFDLTHVHAATDGGAVTRTGRAMCERNDCLNLLEETVPALQSEGKTVVLVGSVGQSPTDSGTQSGETEARIDGLIAVADGVRPEAKRAISRLRELGVERTVMLTGDNERTARAIAEQVGVDEFRAELLPEQKVDAVRELDDEFEGGVAMVGDGVNDAPALAVATVGIAMGAAGTDTAIETADVALLGDDLSRLPYLYELAGETNAVIRQNVWTSLAAKAALALGVPFGLVPIWAAVLIGDAGMTVGVTANAMRLSGISADGEE